MADLAYGEVYTMTREKARMLLVQEYLQTGSFSKAAKTWHTSRRIVRKWHRRYLEEGLEGLQDRSHRPHTMPRKTSEEVEAEVLDARKQTGYGRHRLAIFLRRVKGITISPNCIRHILRRKLGPRQRKRRKPLYPAMWAWEQEEPFSLVQTDVKDVHDKQALGTERITHLERQHLPRYQWTACDGRTRLRFLAYSHRLNRTNGIAFMILVLMWLRAHGITTKVTFQTDWGQEFGGNNPSRIAQIASRFLHPLGGDLRRYPMGRKGYNGRVERSHRTDDEELYRPYLLQAKNVDSFLGLALHWIYFYNAIRPHYGKGMGTNPPSQVLSQLGYTGPASIAAMPPVLLAPISSDLLLACDPEGGTDLLTRYTVPFVAEPEAAFSRFASKAL